MEKHQTLAFYPLTKYEQNGSTHCIIDVSRDIPFASLWCYSGNSWQHYYSYSPCPSIIHVVFLSCAPTPGITRKTKTPCDLTALTRLKNIYKKKGKEREKTHTSLDSWQQQIITFSKTDKCCVCIKTTLKHSTPTHYNPPHTHTHTDTYICIYIKNISICQIQQNVL